MLASGAIELNDTLSLIRILLDGSTDCKNITIRVPLACLNEHAGVNQVWLLVVQLSHELKSTALIGNTEAGCLL